MSKKKKKPKDYGPPKGGYEPLNDTPTTERTYMDCHECNKEFVAEVDFTIEGKFVVRCPHCLHPHCRTIEKGKITEDRWDTRNHESYDSLRTCRAWKSGDQAILTSSAAEFMKRRWLEKRM